MNKQNKVDQLVEQTLGSLDNLQQLEPNEFLAAKAWHQLQNRNVVMPYRHNKLLFRLVAVLIVFVGINCFSFYIMNSNSKKQTESTTGVNAFADAYGLNNYSENY